MDSSTNEDAAKFLKGILNIGGTSNTENGQGSSASHENTGGNERLKNGHEFAAGDVTESIDSYSAQGSDSFALDPVLQFVDFTGDEQQGSVAIFGNEVHVNTGKLDSQHFIVAGSNRVRVNPVVNYDWDSKFYNGNLVSVSSKYMAYALRGKAGFMLRILNRKTVQKALIKGFTGSIEDVSFAHYNSDQLGSIDSAGDVRIWIISEHDDKINYTLKLHLKRKNEELPEVSDGNRLVWCPYVVDGDDDDDENMSERVLALNVGRVAEVLDIDVVMSAHGDTVHVESITKGIVRVQRGHTKFITDIALAPDGSVLATGSLDGGVKFWQLDFQSGDSPLCLHEWQPHNGEPVSRLMFCDNHLVQDDKSPFWRFLITGARHNTELKVWCTVTWSCLQTIRFKPLESSLGFVSPPPLKMKASLDLSAQFLVLSDIHRKVLYAFLLHQNVGEGKAHVTSVAHFFLTQPLLSFVISEAKMFKASVRDSMDQNDDREEQEQDDEGRDDNDEVKPIPTIRIKLHCINPKAMQEMTVQYYPFASVRPVSPVSVAASSMTNSETGVQDGLSDVSGLDTSLTELEDVETRSESSTPKLIAPNAFASVPKPATPTPVSQSDDNIPASQSEPVSVTSSITSVTSMNISQPSVNIDQLLEKSQHSENECSFKTCDDATLQEQPSGFNSWLTSTSPPDHPLPESPDPAKVPFPPFKTEKRGVEQPLENDNIPGITHSTPLRQPNRDQDDDADKTPTEGEKLPTEQDILFVPPSFPENAKEIANPPDENVDNQKLAFAGGASQSEFGAIGSERSPRVDRMKEGADVSSFQSPVIGQFGLANKQTDIQMNQGLPQRRSRHITNLTVTPRRHIDIQPEESASEQVLPDRDSAAIEEIRGEIRQLREILQNQQREQNVKVSEVLREEVAVLEGAISTRLETILSQHNAEQDQIFEKFTRDKQVNEKQRHEKMTTSITTAVLNKVEKTVKNEIRNSVGSSIQKIVTPLQDELNTVMTQKLTVADEVMRESIAKMVKDKSVLDAIGKVVNDAIQISFSTTMNDFFNRSVLPGFEKACRAMYSQINTAFENGTKQYIQNFESYAENRKDIEKQQKDTIVAELENLVKNFQSASNKLSTSMSGSLLEMMQTQLTSSMKKLQSSLLAQLQEDLQKSLQETIQKEITSVLVEQSVFNNESRNEAQHKHTQQHIEELINDKDFTNAFQTALTAADLHLVIMVCQSCDPVDLLAQDPCPLSQPILLSLIQQLSVDLSSDTELKHRYLQEALVALDTEDPITREHVTGILGGLCEQITVTLQLITQNDSANPLKRDLKRLLMAANSLLK